MTQTASQRQTPFSRWAQETFSRQSLVAGVKTLCWLAPLTVLIWIYAERSQVVTSPDITIPIGVVSSDPAHYHVELRMSVENDTSVIAQLSGPQGQLDNVRKLITPQGSTPAVVLTIDTTQRGLRELDTARELSQNHIFGPNGVTVTNCKPAVLRVFVDDIVEDEAEVQVDPDEASAVSAEFTPAKVKFRAPDRDIQDAKANGPLVVYADIDKSLLSQPGKQNDVTLHFKSDALKDAVFPAGDTVKANLDVHPANIDVTGEIKSIPVHELGPIDVVNNNKLQSADGINAIANVHVIGPKDKIDALNSGEERPVAILKVTNADEGARTSRPLDVQLPPGVRLDEKYPLKPFEFQLIKRNAE